MYVIKWSLAVDEDDVLDDRMVLEGVQLICTSLLSVLRGLRCFPIRHTLISLQKCKSKKYIIYSL